MDTPEGVDARALLRAEARAGQSQPLLLLVGGPPGSGKSGVAIALGEAAGLVTLQKDAFKEPLMSALGVESVQDSQRMGTAALIALYTAADAVLSRRLDVLVESTLTRDDLERIAALQREHRCATLQVHVTAHIDVLAERWQARAGTRHPGHLDDVRLPEMRRRVEAGTWEPLQLDAPLRCVDTSAGGGFDLAAWLDELRRTPPAAATR
jgi:predicted kinase